MIKIAHFMVLASVLACPLTAYASNETWVSHTGSDNNTCFTPSAPCKTLSVALGQTSPGGQINVMDSGDFGPVIITQSVSIVNATSGTATNLGQYQTVLTQPLIGSIIIVAGTNGVVTVRGFVLNGLDFQNNVVGVLINNASQVNIENCLLLNNGGAGIYVSPSLDGESQTLATSINVNIQDSTITGNGAGIKIAPMTTTPINVVIDKARINNNSGGGLRVDGTSGANIAVSVSDSSLSLNKDNGVIALSGAGGVMVNLTRDIIASNGQNGIEASGGNTAVLVDNTSILNNATAALSTVSSGRLLTYQNNRVVGALGTGFTGTAAPQ
jgi:parallel beta-helix repeat protein